MDLNLCRLCLFVIVSIAVGNPIIKRGGLEMEMDIKLTWSVSSSEQNNLNDYSRLVSLIFLLYFVHGLQHQIYVLEKCFLMLTKSDICSIKIPSP